MGIRFDLNGSNALFVGTAPLLAFAAETVTAINGWHLQFILRRRPGQPALITKTTGSGITITDAVNGVFAVQLSKADLAALAPGKYWYSALRTDSGFEDVLAYGEVMVLPSA